MTYDIFLSVASMAAILLGVAMLATLATLALETFGGSERGLTMPLFVCLAAIWATAVLVIVLIRLTI
jgi:hypothetical protein